MDPRDRGEGVEPGGEKAARSWRPMAWEPERWRGKGLPAEVEVLMTEGARIEASEEVGFEEVPQYAWPTDEALAEGILEADRALAVLGRDGVYDSRCDREVEVPSGWPLLQSPLLLSYISDNTRRELRGAGAGSLTEDRWYGYRDTGRRELAGMSGVKAERDQRTRSVRGRGMRGDACEEMHAHLHVCMFESHTGCARRGDGRDADRRRIAHRHWRGVCAVFGARFYADVAGRP